jgi:hypothetical protein
LLALAPREALCSAVTVHCGARVWEQDLPSPGLASLGWAGLSWAGLGCQVPCWELQEGLPEEGVGGGVGIVCLPFGEGWGRCPVGGGGRALGCPCVSLPGLVVSGDFPTLERGKK